GEANSEINHRGRAAHRREEGESLMSKQFNHVCLARALLLFRILCSLFLCASVVQTSSAGDWTHWRGPKQSGYSPEKNLPASFSPDGQNLVWKAPFGGRTTPIILNGRVYLINDAKDPKDPLTEQERVMCFDANTGKELWQHRFNVFLTDIVSDR